MTKRSFRIQTKNSLHNLNQGWAVREPFKNYLADFVKDKDKDKDKEEDKDKDKYKYKYKDKYKDKD